MSEINEIIGGMKVHPATSLFPLMEGKEFENLVNSIRTMGMLHPIIVWNGYLIDGRNRLRAVIKLREEGCRPSVPIQELNQEITSVSELIFELNAQRCNFTQEQIADISNNVGPMIDKEKKAKKEAAPLKSKKGVK